MTYQSRLKSSGAGYGTKRPKFRYQRKKSKQYDPLPGLILLGLLATASFTTANLISQENSNAIRQVKQTQQRY